MACKDNFIATADTDLNIVVWSIKTQQVSKIHQNNSKQKVEADKKYGMNKNVLNIDCVCHTST